MWWKLRRQWLRPRSQSPPVSVERLTGVGLEKNVSAEAEPAATRVIRIAGSLRRDTAVESVRQQCLKDIDSAPRRVVLDLEHVEYVDTKFVACLVCLRRAAEAAGVRLELRLSRRVQDWLELCKAGHLFRLSER